MKPKTLDIGDIILLERKDNKEPLLGKINVVTQSNVQFHWITENDDNTWSCCHSFDIVKKKDVFAKLLSWDGKEAPEFKLQEFIDTH